MIKVLNRKPYPSDVTDKEWSIIEPFLLSYQSEAVAKKYELREIMNGIFYVLRTGCSWRSIPHDLPKWTSVYGYFRIWKLDGVFEKMNNEIRKSLRITLDRNAEPSKAIIDSQSVKTTEKGGFVDTIMVRK